MDETGDETLARALLTDLRATQAKLEAAQEDAASLKVLLALRTHQHDLAWQDGRRLEAELAAAGAREAALTGALEDARTAAATAEAASGARAEAASQALACAEERFIAARAVLGAVLASIGYRGLDRRRFRDLLAQAGREAPDTGPGAARHAVLLAEGRRVLGIEA